MPAALRLHLTDDERAEVARRFETTRDAETRLRYQMVLLAADGRTAPQIAPLVRRSTATVERVLHRFREEGADGVPHRCRPGRPPEVPPVWEAELRRVIERDPHTVGVDSANWTTQLLAELLGPEDRPPRRNRDGAGAPAQSGLRLQAAHLDAAVQSPGAAGVGKKRLAVEGVLAWRAGWFDWALADGRCAAPFCAQLRRAVERSTVRGRKAIVVLDNLGIHTPRRSKLLRALLEEYKDDLLLVYTPAYDPDANRIEWLWRALRAAVTHNHRRQTLEELLSDATVWADALTPAEVLAHIGSPFADEPESPEELQHAA